MNYSVIVARSAPFSTPSWLLCTEYKNLVNKVPLLATPWLAILANTCPPATELQPADGLKNLEKSLSTVLLNIVAWKYGVHTYCTVLYNPHANFPQSNTTF